MAETARYYSEPINDEERLEVVLRYVHQEPWRLGMTDSQNVMEVLDEWAWSSWHEYVGLGSDLPNVCKQLLQNGASIRQMEKLTGIGRGVIQNL